MKHSLMTTVLLMVLAALFATTIFLAEPMEKSGDIYLQNTLKKASISFAGARAINALVSVLQKIEAGGSLKLLGTGGSATIAPFEWLDPINDLAEWFSLIMLASCVSVGIQMFINQAMPWLGVMVLLPLAGALLILALVIRISGYSAGRLLFRSGCKTLVITILLTGMIPAMAAVNHAAYKLFLNDTYETAAATLQAQSDGIAAAEKKSGVMEAVAGLAEQAESLKEKAARLVDHILDLIVVFLVQTILLPLVIVWLFVKLITRLLLGRGEWPFETAFDPNVS
ncbi:hypothetical protein [Desulfosudis oleivorans]|uniref:Uncharacterized protein n=1 Tax=Desulfosudis oleivorans (strain DSM 6200 / JCM 39069 / Hxd3) TaxID=96561 RepID=A8ZTA8_DESOH|nr:hypothetical protein [Desulfosudis oleivorans]ABW67791.1 hypothetical protein Dole_1987 [Desulfosudis oleivorans Hxd3]